MSETYAVARGERAQEWQTVFGTDRLPLVSAVPESGRLPGAKEYVPVVLVDFEALTQEQRARGVAHLA
ncbi:MAG: hypothetical protein NTZ05_02130, partial [Chloroflexi bacterium]|nr:hypothetical protein [Chloroflexota bacterium]